MNVRFILLASLLTGVFVFAQASDAMALGHHRHGRVYVAPVPAVAYWGGPAAYRHTPAVVYRRAPVAVYYRSPAYHGHHAYYGRHAHYGRHAYYGRHSFYGGSAAKYAHSRHAGRHGRYCRH